MYTFFKKFFNCCNSQQPINSYLSTNYVFTDNPNKFAITIGVNYDDNDINSDDLYGCINDLNNINEFLLEKCNFTSSQIISLCNTDATKENIEKSISSMINFSNNNPDAELWFSFSGHGAQKISFIEKDGKTELICPVDYKTNGYISDNWLNSNLCNKLNDSSKLFVLMDCCHSGSNLDLQYNYVNNKVNSVGTPLTNKANIIKISGCKDSQVSVDYFNSNDSEHQGVLTNAFLTTNHKSNKFSNRVKNINKYLRSRNFNQIPLLSFSKQNLAYWSLYDSNIELII